MIVTLASVFVGSFAQANNTLSADELATIFPDDPTISPSNVFGTWLYNFKGCNKAQKGAIKTAYDDFKTLADQDGVKEDIDFNSAAALEYLGPSALNKNQQDDFKKIFANAATVYPGSVLTPIPLANYISVRCDDPAIKCPVVCKTDSSDAGTVTAYSSNTDPDDARYPFINFCPAFFVKPTLAEAVHDGSILTDPRKKFKMTTYDNQAQTMFHELMHLDVVTNVKPNPFPIKDITVTVENIRDGKFAFRNYVVYGPQLCKMLARFQPDPDNRDFDTGFFTERNADSYAWFVMARYVTDKLGGSYPYLPLITGQKMIGPPFINPGSNTVIETTVTKGTAVIINPNNIDDNPTCSDSFDKDEAAELATDGPFNLTIKRFVDDSVYPKSYLDQRNAFIEQNLFVPSTATSPSPPKCLGNGVQPDGNFPFSVSDGMATIKQICTDPAALDATISPTSSVARSGLSGSNNLWAQVAFLEGCVGTSRIAVGTTAKEMQSYCTAQFSSIMNGCDTGTTSAKWGGSLAAGCLLYRMEAVAQSATPFQKRSDPMLEARDPSTRPLVKKWTA